MSIQKNLTYQGEFIIHSKKKKKMGNNQYQWRCTVTE